MFTLILLILSEESNDPTGSVMKRMGKQLLDLLQSCFTLTWDQQKALVFLLALIVLAIATHAWLILK